jgi:hypothetical protein
VDLDSVFDVSEVHVLPLSGLKCVGLSGPIDALILIRTIERSVQLRRVGVGSRSVSIRTVSRKMLSNSPFKGYEV